MMLKKEHLLHYMMKGHVHLSKKDYAFFNNLTFILKDKRQITSGQAALFDRLISKYQRQLTKLGYATAQLAALEWQAPVVATLAEYLVPRISLEDQTLCLRAPFNNKFVQHFRNLTDNTFKWDREQKMYRSEFYTHALKMAINSCFEHFDRVEYCDQIKQLLETVAGIRDQSLVPLLVKQDQKFSVLYSNRCLDEAIKDIELNDQPETLFKLSQYGVFASDRIIAEDRFLQFASEYMTTLDIDELLQNIDYFTRLNITDVCFPVSQRSARENNIDKALVKIFVDNNIKIHANFDTITDSAVLIKRSFFSYRNTMNPSRKITKIVEIVNSRPIEIK